MANTTARHLDGNLIARIDIHVACRSDGGCAAQRPVGRAIGYSIADFSSAIFNDRLA
jgi:hypothetical protein